MAPHPYKREVAPCLKRLSKAPSTKMFTSLAKEKTLQRLIPETGELSLPIEAVNRVQFLVEPRFSLQPFTNKSRSFVTEECSKDDWKEQIVKFLKSGTTSMAPWKIIKESQSESPILPPTSAMDTGQQVPDGPTDIHTAARKDGHPLFKLEEMKQQLPAVTDQSTDLQGPFYDPGSPSSTTSSGSGRANGEEVSSRKPFLPYNGSFIVSKFI